jgi:prefoldin subunit 5
MVESASERERIAIIEELLRRVGSLEAQVEELRGQIRQLNKRGRNRQSASFGG